MRALSAVVAAALLGLGTLAGAPWSTPAAPEGELLFSLLAVGDTGTEPAPRTSREQLEVARAMAAEDDARPVDAVVLLGDQFYPVGLLQSELVPRVRENVVRPLCHFLDLGAPRSAAVADACPPAARLHAVPIHVILGNHDYMSDASPRLEREAVPEFVANWSVPSGVVEVVQPAPGVSLILLDTLSLALRPERASEVRDALAASPGPWRIVAGHRPLAAVDSGEDADPRNLAARDAMVRAIEGAGVPVHVYVSGHEHNLQLGLGADAAPALHVIAGGGSSSRPIRGGAHEMAVTKESLGYARIDLVRRPAGERLVVSLFSVGGFWPGADEGRRLARWSVDPQGGVDVDDRPERGRDDETG